MRTEGHPKGCPSLIEGTMTTIETDNPLIHFWVSYYDFIWKYWPIVAMLFAAYLFIAIRKLKRDRKAHREHMAKMDKDIEELRRIRDSLKR